MTLPSGREAAPPRVEGEPLATVTLEPDPDAAMDVTLKETDTKAGLLSDIGLGNTARSSGNIGMTMSISIGGQSMDMGLEIGVRLSTDGP